MGRGGSSEAGEGSSLLLSRADQESRSLVEVWKTPESSAPAGKRGRQGGGFWAGVERAQERRHGLWHV